MVGNCVREFGGNRVSAWVRLFQFLPYDIHVAVGVCGQPVRTNATADPPVRVVVRASFYCVKGTDNGHVVSNRSVDDSSFRDKGYFFWQLRGLFVEGDPS